MKVLRDFTLALAIHAAALGSLLLFPAHCLAGTIHAEASATAQGDIGGDSGETFASASASSFVSGGFQSASATSSVTPGGHASLGARAAVSANSAFGRAFWIDTLYFSGSEVLTFVFSLDGTPIANPARPELEPYVGLANGLYGYSAASAGANVRIGNQIVAFVERQQSWDVKVSGGMPERIASSKEEYSPNAHVDFGSATYFHVSLPVDGTMGWLLELQAVASANPVEGNYALAEFDHTLTLDAILLPDGSTPESHGMTISFASGALSPNVMQVPEPSVLALLAFGCLVLAVSKQYL